MRRNDLQRMTPPELAIYGAMLKVEMVGADPQLTDVVNLLNSAADTLANYIDNNMPKPDRCPECDGAVTISINTDKKSTSIWCNDESCDTNLEGTVYEEVLIKLWNNLSRKYTPDEPTPPPSRSLKETDTA